MMPAVMPISAPMAQKTPRRGYTPPATVLVAGCDELLGRLTSAEHRFAPSRVWVAGDIALARGGLRVSVVGSRDASVAGLRRATKVATLLARGGATVVSGLAKGVDGAAHRAAIRAAGRTVAVIGTAIDRCYPRDHSELQVEIYKRHLLVSQFEPGKRTYPSGFVARNRLMALLSHASVVVEAGDSSGTLSQAAETMRLGRPLFIMRNVVERRDLKWPAKFIAAGAHVLDDVDELLSTVREAARDQAVARSAVDPVPLVLPGCEVS